VKRSDFQELAALRLKEARLLLKANCPEGAYYLAGYAAECALKACIARRTERFEFPDLKIAQESWGHDLSKLAKTAALDEKLREATNRDAELNLNWTIVTKWKLDSRYQRRSLAEAAALISAVEDRNHGIFRWLKRHW
jgi:HEPN domain-containing protein